MSAALEPQGGASAPSTVLPFPHISRRARLRRYTDRGAGFLTLMTLEHNGEAIPPNVQRFDEPEGPQMPERSPELLLAVLLWSQLSARKQAQVRAIVRCMAYGNAPDESARRLHNMLSRRA